MFCAVMLPSLFSVLNTDTSSPVFKSEAVPVVAVLAVVVCERSIILLLQSGNFTVIGVFSVEIIFTATRRNPLRGL